MENLATVKAFVKDMHKEISDQKKTQDFLMEKNVELTKKFDIAFEGIKMVLEQFKARLEKLENPNPNNPATQMN